jgi:hypothetical protein
VLDRAGDYAGTIFSEHDPEPKDRVSEKRALVFGQDLAQAND